MLKELKILMKQKNYQINLKEKFLNHCFENNIFLLFEHDSNVEAASLIKTEKGIRIDKKLKLSELI